MYVFCVLKGEIMHPSSNAISVELASIRRIPTKPHWTVKENTFELSVPLNVCGRVGGSVP